MADLFSIASKRAVNLVRLAKTGYKAESADCISHIRQEISFGPLLVSREVFEELIRAHSVFPRFKDMMVYMGRRNLEVEVAPPRFQMNVLENDSNESTYRSFGKTSGTG
jgi:hypothetical protein